MALFSPSTCRRSFLTASLAGLGALVVPRASFARGCGGVNYAETRTVEGKTLKLNGVGVREATFLMVDVYVAALYVENVSTDGSKIVASKELKHLVLTLVRDIDAKTMNDAIDDGFKKNAGGAYGSMKPRIEKLRSVVPDLKKGHVFELTFLASGDTKVSVNGSTKATIPGSDFSQALLKIWLGPSPPNEGLKRGLLGGAC